MFGTSEDEKHVCSPYVHSWIGLETKCVSWKHVYIQNGHDACAASLPPFTDENVHSKCAQDLHPALGWRHFGSAPILLTAFAEERARFLGRRPALTAFAEERDSDQSSTSTASQVQTHHTSSHKIRRCGDVQLKTFQTLGCQLLALSVHCECLPNFEVVLFRTPPTVFKPKHNGTTFSNTSCTAQLH